MHALSAERASRERKDKYDDAAGCDMVPFLCPVDNMYVSDFAEFVFLFLISDLIVR